MRFGVFVSGGGTNLQALLDAERRGELTPGEIAVVVCNRPGAGALARAAATGKPAIVVDHKEFSGREPFEDALAEVCAAHRVDAVILAGFMRLLTMRFLARYPERVINIHPSLLPAFPGVDAQRQAFDYGVKISGCTVHFVDSGLDAGPVIAQAQVPVLPGDDVESLRARILAEEHRLLPSAAQALAAGHLARRGRHVSHADAGVLEKK